MSRDRSNWKKPHPLYASWNMMKQRCYNPNNHKFHLYGGRGIRVCKRWRDSFSAFLKDMGPRPSPKHSIDRINTNGDYKPSNCRWATHSEQRMNYRDCLNVSCGGLRLSLKEWAKRRGVKYGTMWMRFKRGQIRNAQLERKYAS